MRLPFFRELESARRVLLAGMGGGYDLFSGLPLYFSLRSQGCQVHLANLSFSAPERCHGHHPIPSVLQVNGQSQGASGYFPELHLSRHLNTCIYAIQRAGAGPVCAAYDWLVKHLQPDTLILVDGGTDSLMRGDEFDLATPEEDIASLLAAHRQAVPRKFVIAIGFGIDAYHGVCHAQFLENVAALIHQDGFLGSWGLTRDMPEFALFREACHYVYRQMPRHPSIVNSSIIAAVEGHFGDWHATSRTQGSKLFINPLMSLFWAFRLDKVAEANLYLDQLVATESYADINSAINEYRARLKQTRPYTRLPG